jgi:phage regulator Rha-like protein
MKTEIVHISKKEIFTDSKVISEMLEVNHKDLLRTIAKIVIRQKNNVPRSPLKFPQKFIESAFHNKMNREYKMYELNEQAYMKLAMNLKGYEKAEYVQDCIIEAFSMMKQALLNHQNTSWLNARNKSKEIRSSEMDIVKEFVAYATKQGSKKASMYYRNITKMTNKALELLIQSNHGAPLRDLASIMELGFIQILDNRAMQSINQGMVDKLPYRFIYKYAKEEVNKLADSLNFNKQLSK